MAGSPNSPDFLPAVRAENDRLVDIARAHSVDTSIPGCPGWQLADLIAHVGGAVRWATSCVQAGLEPVARRLPEPPEGVDPVAWLDDGAAELLEVLSSVPPEQLVWAPIGAARPSQWWRRKAATEIAIHRWDAEHATSATPLPLETSVAVAGIAEFTEDFLPGMLAMVGPAPSPSIRLRLNDIDSAIDIPLTRGSDGRPAADAVEVSGSASDLLLWMWNRPVPASAIDGSGAITEWWKGLAI